VLAIKLVRRPQVPGRSTIERSDEVGAEREPSRRRKREDQIANPGSSRRWNWRSLSYSYVNTQIMHGCCSEAELIW